MVRRQRGSAEQIPFGAEADDDVVSPRCHVLCGAPSILLRVKPNPCFSPVCRSLGILVFDPTGSLLVGKPFGHWLLLDVQAGRG